MTQTAEQNEWYRGKRPVIDEYLSAVKKVENLTAGQGFLYRPGHLGMAITEIERITKFKLSDVNYNIVKQAIERELAQTGHDYDIAVKDAMIAWELEKTTTMTELQQEFANAKKVRDLDNQQLDRLEITTNLRKFVIMASKTAIDIDMEELRQELTNVDRSTFAAEDTLLEAKLLTGRKKLEVIPYIEIVLEKQQLIIDAENDNAQRKEALVSAREDLGDKRIELITARELIADAVVTLIAAKQELVAKKVLLIDAKELIATQETTNVGYLDQYIQALSGLDDVQKDLIAAKRDLIPFINNKSAALIAYAAELDAWIVVKEAIALIKKEMATLREDRVDKRGDVIDSKVALNVLELALREARLGLQTAKMVGASDLLTAKIVNAADWLTEKEVALTSAITRESELVSSQSDLDVYGQQISLETMRAVNDISITAELNSLLAINRARIDEKEEIAAIASEAEITSQLIHLLA